MFGFGGGGGWGGFGGGVRSFTGGLGDRLQAGGRALGGGQGAGNPYTSGTGGAFGQGGGSAGEYGNYGGFSGGWPMQQQQQQQAPGRMRQPFGNPNMPQPILRPNANNMPMRVSGRGYEQY
jgi:hypothetical protein